MLFGLLASQRINVPEALAPFVEAKDSLPLKQSIKVPDKLPPPVAESNELDALASTFTTVILLRFVSTINLFSCKFKPHIYVDLAFAPEDTWTS